MISSELLRQVRRIEIMTGRLVSETFSGEYLSAFKGRGMEFAEVREYSAGDDIRSIDWNVTARTGRPHVRRYVEERELTMIIACDVSASQAFGTAERLKKEVSAELSAVLAFCALRNNDKVGLFLFSEDVEEFVPPGKGRRHVLHVIRDVLAYEPRRRGTRIGPALDRINRTLTRGSILLLISDFQDSGFDGALRLAALKHDVIPIVVGDPRELELPRSPAILELNDPETGDRTWLDARSASSLSALKELESRRLASLDRLFSSCGLDAIRVGTQGSFIDPVVEFFRRRARRLRR